MQTASSFLTFSEGEQVFEEWEFLSDPGGLRAADFISVGIPGGLGVMGLLGVQHFGFSAILFGAFGLIPAGFILWEAITRPYTKGHICLTNWRLIYYEEGQGTGIRRRHHYVSSANLEGILGIFSVYEEGLLGSTSLTVNVHTRFEEGLAIKIGDSGGLLAKIPVIGGLFRRTTIGKDAFKILPALFSLIQEHQGTAVQTSSQY